VKFIACFSLVKGFSEQIVLALSPNNRAVFTGGSLSQAVFSFLCILSCPPRPSKLNKSNDFVTKHPNKKPQVKFVHICRDGPKILLVVVVLRGLASYA